MSDFKQLQLRHSYTGKGTRILKEFLLPVLDKAVSYDRVTSFCTFEYLVAISQGIESIYNRHGKMRLIIGVHSFPKEMAEATLKRDFLASEIDAVRHEITEGLKTIGDELTQKRVATVAWMIDDGLLEVKAASIEGEGIFHPKTLIFEDTAGNRIAAVGSPNETGSGLGGNYEQLMIANSWESNDAVDDQIEFFESLWTNTNDDAVVEDISDSLAEAIIAGLGPAYSRNNMHFEQNVDIISASSDMPTNFFVSGDIPALFQHQERAVIDALSRWPVRVLFSDEVGLGKTFEAAATMAFLVKYGGVGRVIILTPKSVLQQWQDELKSNFNIDAWLFDSQSRCYFDPSGREISMGTRNPIGAGAPSIMLLSAQYARGGSGRKNIFERAGAILPDLLILDEAHSARVRVSLDGSTTSTKMYDMIESVSRQIPHLILATATPMQKDANEYHSMLKLLGLPKAWQGKRAYNTSLSLIASEAIPDTNDAYTAGKLIRSSVSQLKPSLKQLADEEREIVNGLVSFGTDPDMYDIAAYVQGNWINAKKALIKLHPAHLLTVRNTRRALENVGYVFPKRNLIEESIDSSDEIRLFYESVNDYITGLCFSVEKILNPDKKLSIGFIKANYQQRVASSLYSCKKSLSRRLEKLLALREHLAKSGLLDAEYASLINDSIDDFDEDELVSSGSDFVRSFSELDGKVDIEELSRAIDLESTSISPLLKRIDSILVNCGDMKIERSIQVALKHIQNGDKVLLFSRYTDTVDALIQEFEQKHLSAIYPYGIYTGQDSSIIIDGKSKKCTKDEIKQSLRSGAIMLMFCSDAASEGLNLQSARVLINVDVPWTPARLEQRIGRVARLGQKASEVDIHNVWYPSSIEARMYRRIQSRLEESNLAIGEFPDVVAESIKNAILDESEYDNSAEELREIRNSTQTKALAELWSVTSVQKTTSNYIRQRLLSVCMQQCKSFEQEKASDLWSFETYDGGTFAVTERDGCEESISYKDLKEAGIKCFRSDVHLARNEANDPLALIFDEDTSSYVDFEFIPDLAMGKSSPTVPFSQRPKMLPDPNGMDLSCSVDVAIPSIPSLWGKGEINEG